MARVSVWAEVQTSMVQVCREPGAGETIEDGDGKVIVSGLWHDITKDPYSAVGDGSTDNTTAIQAAILAAEAAACASGTTAIVWIPAGVFLTNRLRITSGNIIIMGAGRCSVIQSVSAGSLTNLPPFDGTIGGLINIYPSSGYTWGSEGSKIANVTLKNFQIRGPYTTQQTYQSSNQGVIFESVNQLKIEDLELTGFGGETIWVGPSTICDELFISRNEIHDSCNGMTIFKARYGKVLHNWVTTTWSREGIKAGGAGMTYLDNHSTDAYTHGFWITGWSGDVGTQGGGALTFALNHSIRAGVDGTVTSSGIYIEEDDPTFPQLQPIHLNGNVVFQARQGYGVRMLLRNAASIVYVQNTHVTDTGLDLGSGAIAIFADGTATYEIDGYVLRPGTDGGQDYGIHVGNTFSPAVYIGEGYDAGHSNGSPTSTAPSVWLPLKRAAGSFVAFSDGDATPDVSGGENFTTANTGATTISQFDLPTAASQVGKTIRIAIADANTTLQFSGPNLNGNNGVDWTGAVGDSVIATWSGSAWYCLVESATGIAHDPNAIHDNVANEISAIAAKSPMVAADLWLIEDSAALFVKKKVAATHANLALLGADDHSQYHNDTRGDARYYQKTEFINVSAGVADAGKPIVLDAAGLIDDSMISNTLPYLLLDCSNDPLTGVLDFAEALSGGDVIHLADSSLGPTDYTLWVGGGGGLGGGDFNVKFQSIFGGTNSENAYVIDFGPVDFANAEHTYVFQSTGNGAFIGDVRVTTSFGGALGARTIGFRFESTGTFQYFNAIDCNMGPPLAANYLVQTGNNVWKKFDLRFDLQLEYRINDSTCWHNFRMKPDNMIAEKATYALMRLEGMVDRLNANRTGRSTLWLIPPATDLNGNTLGHAEALLVLGNPAVAGAANNAVFLGNAAKLCLSNSTTGYGCTMWGVETFGGDAIMVEEPTTVNHGHIHSVLPSGTATRAEVRVYNQSNIIAFAYATLGMKVNAAIAELLVTETGVPTTQITDLDIGGNATATALAEINFRFQNNVRVQFTPTTVVMADAQDFVFNVTTGTKIATANTQKLAFWGATPIVRPTAAGAGGHAAVGGANVNANDTFTGGVGATAYTIGDLVAILKTVGLITT